MTSPPLDTATAGEWARLDAELTACRACPRLVAHREQVARVKRAAFAGQQYWGCPVPGFGDRRARVVLVGLAPAAHGANRTGRMFTGDRSGDWLYRALFTAGFANQAVSRDRADGLTLTDAFVSAANRCAPPGNRPTPAERDACRDFLERELDLIDAAGPGVRVLVALGQFAWNQVLRILRDRQVAVPRPKRRFGHGVALSLGASGETLGFPRRDLLTIASYHPSQQNTFTGRLTRDMLDAVFARARKELAG